MWLDLFALAVLAYLTLSGARRGALVSFLRAFSLLGAYGAAFLLGPPLGARAADLLGVPALVALGVAGAAVFLAAIALLSIVTAFIRRAQKHRDIEQERHPGDRAAGALFGALQGAFLVVLLGLLAGWVEVGRKAGALAGLPDPGGHTVAAAAQTAIETAADTMLDETNLGGRAAARLAARPDRALEDAHKLMESPAVHRLQQDPIFWTYLEEGAIDQALHSRSFIAFSEDAEVRDSIASYGLMSPDDAGDPARFRAQMRPVLKQIGPRVRTLRRDPALRELAEDPATRDALLQGNTLALLGDPRFRSLLQRVLEGGDSVDSVPAAPALD
jgi:uncharacterized membrane protein required for colicin V production